MCGFAGFAHIETGNTESVLFAMGEAIHHRGPDDRGTFFDNNVGFVHQRLSIQDLSPLGNQPMLSQCGRFQLVFNGEIYNFKDLRSQLEEADVTFKGHSDTEVILAGFALWGVRSTLEKMVGMFALALYDTREARLYLARDRMGEKPLYYSFIDGGLLFGSELSALKQHPSFQHEIDRNSLCLLLRHNLIPAPHSIYKSCKKLLPAEYMVVDLSQEVLSENKAVTTSYWQLDKCFEARKDQADLSFDELSEQLENCLSQSIDQQMIADTPLGAFLSGGIDSSTVVALMQKQSNQPVKTFSIGFNEPGFNEAEHAKAVAEHLGTEHTELYVSADDALAVVNKLPEIYDEPFADSSQLPTYLLCQMTKQHVTVALSGDGGDELLCGYSRYLGYAKRWQSSDLKDKAKACAINLPNRLLMPMVKLIHAPTRRLPALLLREKLHRQKRLALSTTLEGFYRQAVSYWVAPEQLVVAGAEPDYGLTLPTPEVIVSKQDDDKLYKTMMWQDLNWYLPDDILVKVDRAAMANSLETRVPMLDHRFVERALAIDTQFNVKDGVGKQLLRDILYRHVPRKLVDRPKTGFGIPINEWLRSNLKPWADKLLDRDRLEREGYFDAQAIERVWQTHSQGLGDYGFELWGVLMFQAWLEQQEIGHTEITC